MIPEPADQGIVLTDARTSLIEAKRSIDQALEAMAKIVPLKDL